MSGIYNKAIAGALAAVKEEVATKYSNIFGVDWDIALQFLKQANKPGDAGVYMVIAPAVIRSFTSKDKGVSARILNVVANLPSMADFLIKGRSGMEHNVNMALLRLVSLAIVMYTKPEDLKDDAVMIRAYREARKTPSVLNGASGPGSDASKEIARQTLDKIGIITEVQLKEAKLAVSGIVKAAK